MSIIDHAKLSTGINQYLSSWYGALSRKLREQANFSFLRNCHKGLFAFKLRLETKIQGRQTATLPRHKDFYRVAKRTNHWSKQNVSFQYNQNFPSHNGISFMTWVSMLQSFTNLLSNLLCSLNLNKVLSQNYCIFSNQPF